MNKWTAMAIFAVSMSASAMAQNVWNITVDSDTDQLQPVSREFARGESWAINPLVTDDGIPRVWPTNTTFLFFWQTSAMKTNWWFSTNVNSTVYHSVTITNVTPVVTTYVTNLTLFTYPTTNSYTTNTTVNVETGTVNQVYTNSLSNIYTNIIGSSTNVLTNTVTFVGTNTFVASATVTNMNVATNIVYLAPQTNSTTVSQQFTSYTTGYTVTNIVDTGRVSAAWNYTMDAGASSYNWYLGAFDSSGDVTFRINGTIVMRGAPGNNGTFTNANWFFPWATTSYVNSLFQELQSYALRVTNNVSQPGYFYLQSPIP